MPSYRLPIRLGAVSCAAALALVIFASVRSSDAVDRYGKAPVPGTATVELPAREVTVYYEEAVDLAAHENLHPPPGFGFEISDPSGEQRLPVRNVAREQIEADNQARVSVGAVNPPAPGVYLVTTDRPTDEASSPALVFGDSDWAVFTDSLTPWIWACAAGIVLAALAGIAVRIRPARERG